MRRFYPCLLMALTISVISVASCEKETPVLQVVTPPPTPTPPTPPPPTNTAPLCFAGEDIWVVEPDNFCILTGSASDRENNIEKYEWKQVAGPLSGNIETPASKETKVFSLSKGVYEFEFSVTDKGGLNNRDTVTVFVREPAAPGNGEAHFKDIRWECPMGCWVKVSCFSCIVPINQPFKVFVKRSTANQWIEAVSEDKWTVHDKYSYGIYNNNLFVFASEEDVWNETAEVKITY